MSTTFPVPRPEPEDLAPFYRGYLREAPEGPALELLERQLAEVVDLLEGVPPGRRGFAYADDKWTVRGVVSHLSDTERVFGYRAWAMSRGENADLPGMDENAYAARSRADRRPWRDLVEELIAVRRSNLLTFRGFDEEMWARKGRANGVEFPAAAFPWLLLGHLDHHVGVLRDRYLTVL